jgi:iron complex outermembrane receptor protein
MKRTALAGLIWCALLSAPSMADAADTPKQSIDMPSDDLISSLELLARQSGIEIIYDADQLRGIRAPAISGFITPKEAVMKLLEGTHLGLTEHPGGALLITAPLPGNPSNSPRGPADGSPRQPIPNTGGASAINQRSKERADLDEIIVTGTNIRGEVPVGAALIVYTREDIDQSGSATLEQFARQMPENFAGVDTIANLNTNANLGIVPRGASSNIFGGAAFDLNGLGVGSTLTLLNGHRIALAGFDGSFVDISEIPVSAIDHLEVLDDGASAIYGSDAVAGVVNIITRKDFTGAETGLRYGASTERGADEFTASQSTGHSWMTGNALFSYEYGKQGGLDASQRSWIPEQLGPLSLIPENRRNSIFASGTQKLGDDTTVSADVLYADREFATDSPLAVAGAWQSSTGRVTESASVVSLDRHLFADWHANMTGNYSEIRQRSTINTYALPDDFADRYPSDQYLSNSHITEVDALSSGSIFVLPGGTAKVSIGGGYRTEAFAGAQSDVAATSTSLRRDVASGYGEILVPLFGDSATVSGVRRMQLSAAYRYDHYRDFGPTSNPKYGWLWEPTRGLRLRGTYGTSFQAPFLSQLGSLVTSGTVLIPDPEASNGRADLLEINGGNPQLHSEQSRSITFGVDVTPSGVPELSATATYFRVAIRDRIQAQNVTSPAILSQPLLSSFLSLNPALATVQSYFSNPGFEGDNAGLGPSGVVAIFDNQLANIYSTIESGIHFSGQYGLPTAFGQFTFSVLGTHLLSERIEPAALGSWFDVNNTIAEPPSCKMRGNIGWAMNGFTSRIGVNYVNAYANTLFTPPKTIYSWTTVDVRASYSTGRAASSIASNIKIAFNVQNLMARRPPEVEIPAGDLLPGRGGIPFDGANASPVGRLISLQVTKSW